MVKSKDVRREFVLNFVKMCTLADIPLEKMATISYCAQVGALPQTDQLRSVYVPRLFEDHFTALKAVNLSPSREMRLLMFVTIAF